MRLHPTVSADEARDWLLEQAVATLGAQRGPDLEKAIEPFAEAMAAISAVELPDDLEPAFP
ncbi:MAG TPA: hypothetical protein VIR57_08725 [Chloroflexota bacterium]|jgi:hypothetical protein